MGQNRSFGSFALADTEAGSDRPPHDALKDRAQRWFEELRDQAPRFAKILPENRDNK